MFVCAASGAVACAAILGIDDREPLTEEDGGQSAGFDATIDGAPSPASEAAADADTRDAPVEDAPELPRAILCDPGTCGTAGGSCGDGGCTFACTGTSCDRTIQCPPSNDCLVVCGGQDTCKGARCVGGRSCTFDCSGDKACKEGIACQSDICDIRCTGAVDTCKSGGAGAPIACDAGVCIVECAGEESCNKGVLAYAGTYCGITCSGTTACNAEGIVSCGSSPDASITCADSTCVASKPSCRGGSYCSISCTAATACKAKVCCENTTCVLDDRAKTAGNVCP